MRISRSIQGNSVLAETSPVVTTKSYFSKLTGSTESDVLADKVIFSKNIWSTPGTRQHVTHFSGATKVLSFLFEAEKYFVANSQTGESDTVNETEYVSIREVC